MKRSILRLLRRSGILLALMIAAAIATGMASPAAAAKPGGAGKITAQFDPLTATLTVRGDQRDNAATISRNAAGTILVNGGDVRVQGGTPTVANTALIE